MDLFLLCLDDDEGDGDICYAPQSKCDHDIVGGVVEVLVLGHAEEDQQVEDQHQGGEGRVASHLQKVSNMAKKRIHKTLVGRPTKIHYSQFFLWKNR